MGRPRREGEEAVRRSTETRAPVFNRFDSISIRRKLGFQRFVLEDCDILNPGTTPCRRTEGGIFCGERWGPPIPVLGFVDNPLTFLDSFITFACVPM